MWLFDKLSAGYNIGKFVKDACKGAGISTATTYMLQPEDIFRILDYLHTNESGLNPRLVGTISRVLVPVIERTPYIEISAENLALETIRQAKLDTWMSPFGADSLPSENERRIVHDLFK